MSDTATQVLAGLAFALLAAGLSARLGSGQARPILVAAVRAGLQLALVGAVVALVFAVPALAVAFVAAMAVAAAATARTRLRGLPDAGVRALAAIALPAAGATLALLGVGAFDATPRAAVPTAGILLGGAMAATSLTGRRLLEALEDDREEIEARLALGDDGRAALRPSVVRAVRTGLVPALDQTRSVGLVTLPGTFVGLVLGGASPETAAATQLVILLALLAVELAAASLIAELVLRALLDPVDQRVALERLDPGEPAARTG